MVHVDRIWIMCAVCPVPSVTYVQRRLHKMVTPYYTTTVISRFTVHFGGNVKCTVNRDAHCTVNRGNIYISLLINTVFGGTKRCTVTR